MAYIIWRRVHWARSGLCPTFNPPERNLWIKNNIHSKEEQEEPKSLPPDAFP